MSWAIGIDLGTTNCALASIGDEGGVPSPAPIPQVVSPGEIGTRPLLPSFLFFPAEGQFPPGSLALPWYAIARDVAGVFARDQGPATPGRLVASAKSWLSQTHVDRRAEILPWKAPEDVPKVSPLQASARYLAHLRAAWDQAHPDDPLAAQDVVLTVPASFDAVARELTTEAAMLAGFDHPPRLLEEPQAAMYDWLAQQGESWRDQVKVGDVILVVDIGGGTTDFSLIAVRDQDGSLELERIAVGDHILLGGDNMDLALAYTLRARLDEKGTRLDDWQLRALTHSCRAAKEALLIDEDGESLESSQAKSYPIVIPSRGSRLLGKTIRTELTRADVDAALLDGFFPLVPVTAVPQAPRRAGLTALGLPYASDAGMTRHLAKFLRAALGAGTDHLALDGHTFVHPTAVLFNGGVTRSGTLRSRIRSVLTQWIEAEGGDAPRVLGGTHADLAVARGAAYYARALRDGGLRIRGGTARAYYVGIERAELAIPGIPPRLDAVCIAPIGMEEGTEVELEASFGLVLGEAVSFRFFGSSTRRDDEVGVTAEPEAVEELSPLQTALEGNPGELVEVRLHSAVTEVGTLELSAVEQGCASPRRWKLSFDVRQEG